MAAFLSPGIYWREQDFSAYVETLASSICGFVGGATWGPANQNTLITDEGQLVDAFSRPTKDDSGLYAAIRYLRRGNQLRYCRVVSTSGAKSSATVIEDTIGVPGDVFTVEGKYYGTFGDTIEVIVSNGSGTGKYNIAVSIIVDSRGNRNQPETFEDVVLTPASDPQFIETIINDGNETSSPSSYITVDVIDGTLVPKADTYALSGGNDGLNLGAADYIGTTYGQNTTGLQVFANPERVDLNVLAVPGVSDAQVVNEILDICSIKRMDCFGLIDSPIGLSPAAVVDWHNGTGYAHTAFNNSYGSVQWPWVEMTDSYNGGTIWAPPSGFMAEVIAYNDYIADPWFAPAGLRRGKISALRTEYVPTKGERDYMYSGGNAINPIMSFVKEGIAVYGQRTLLRTASALNRINVRRLLLTAEKSIATSVRYLDFEPHDETTWAAFTNLVTPFMSDIKRRRGVYDFRVICDKSTNPDTAINRNEMYGKILLKPTKVAEMIIIDFGVLETGASFNE